MRITHQVVGAVDVLQLHGSFSAGDDLFLMSALRERSEAGQKHLVLDLKDASTSDGSLLEALRSCALMVKKWDAKLVLAGVSPRLGESSDLDSLYAFFDLYESEAEAIAAFG